MEARWGGGDDGGAERLNPVWRMATLPFGCCASVLDRGSGRTLSGAPQRIRGFRKPDRFDHPAIDETDAYW